MNVHIKATVRSNSCFMIFTHGFNSTKEAKVYLSTLKETTNNSDTEVIATMYLNTKYNGKD